MRRTPTVSSVQDVVFQSFPVFACQRRGLLMMQGVGRFKSSSASVEQCAQDVHGMLEPFGV